MKIMLANSAFHGAGGSETYLLAVAENLLRLGHDVRIYAHIAGDMADVARRQGIPVVTSTDDFGKPADGVITQDGAVAYEIGAVWPQVPQVYVCHSSLFEFQQPPIVPGHASAVVVMNERERQRMEALNADLRIVRLTQPIDTQRFQPESAPAETPRRALILSNYLAGDARKVLVDTWGEAGVELVQIGNPSEVTVTPEEGIAAADIVVAKGRAALEAMSCGRPTYLYDVFGGDGWITPENYPAIEADGITGNQSKKGTSVAQLRHDLEQYDPEMGRLGRELINRHHNVRTHTHALIELMRDLAPTARPTNPTLETELARQVSLRWAGERELYIVRSRMQQVSTEAQATAAAYVEELDRASAYQRGLEERVEWLERELAQTTASLSEELKLTKQHADNLATQRGDLEAKVESLKSRVQSQRRRIAALRDES